MKKFYLALLSLIITVSAFSRPPLNYFDYSIIFSGPFKNDLVSFSVNKQIVIHKFKVENVNASRKGHLNLTQNSNNITVYYNGAQLKKPKVPVSFIVELEISVNGQQKKFEVDLRKGKVIVVNTQPEKPGTEKGNISIEQIAEVLVFF